MQAKAKKKAEVELVKRRLWSHGFRVKTAAEGQGHDLLVEGEFRVAVRRRGDDFSGTDYDVLAVVEYPRLGKPVVGYTKGGFGEASTSPAAVFTNSPGKGHEDEGDSEGRG